MTEKTPENDNRFFIVPPIGDTTPTVDESDGLHMRPPPVGRYAAYVQIGWPEGVARHPNTDRQVMRRLGRSRICGIDHDSDNLGLTYSLMGDSVDDAQDDADGVLDSILGWVDLGRSAVRYAQILNVPTSQTQSVSSSAATGINQAGTE